MPTVRANGIDIYYELHSPPAGVAADPVPLLLIMGLGLNSLSWRKNLPGLAARRTVIIFDNRGTGRTSRPDEPYSIPLMAADAAGLLDAIGVRRAHVFGFSLGSLVAQELALNFPSKVKSLVLGATTPGSFHHLPSPPGVLDTMVRRGWVDPTTSAEMVIPIIYSRKFLAEHPDQVAADTLTRLVIPTPPYAYRHQMMCAFYHDTWSRLDQLPMPVLLLTGSEDLLVVPANSYRMLPRIPRARLVVLAGAGHYFTSEQPAASNRAVLDFLDSLPGRRPLRLAA